MGAPLRLYRPSPPSTTLFCQLLCHVLDGMNRPSLSIAEKNAADRKQNF